MKIELRANICLEQPIPQDEEKYIKEVLHQDLEQFQSYAKSKIEASLQDTLNSGGVVSVNDFTFELKE